MLELKKLYPDKYDIFITDDFERIWPVINRTDILIVHNGLCEYRA